MIDILPIVVLFFSASLSVGGSIIWLAASIGVLGVGAAILMGITTFSWFGLVIIIFYAGGLMVLFTYFLVLSSSFLYKNSSMWNALPVVLLIPLTLLWDLLDSNSTNPFSMYTLWHEIDVWEVSLNPQDLLLPSFIYFMALVVNILLFTMVVVVNLVGGRHGHLRPYK